MSIDNENLVDQDIDDAVEQVQEELADENQQVESDEETLEEKATKAKVEEEDDEEESDEEESGEDEAEEEEEDEVEVEETMPKTKAAIVNAAYTMLKNAKKEDAEKLYASMLKAGSLKEDAVEEEVSEQSEVEVSHIDYQEDLDVLVAEEATLSDGFRGKAGAIFEAALKSKVGSEIERLEAEYANNLEEEVTSVKSDLVESVDGYLNYVVENWMKENQVAVENGLRTEIAEDFMKSLQSVFKEHYIAVPEGKEDLVATLSDQVSELEEQLNKTTDENVQLFQAVQENTREEIVRKYSADLAATEAEKLASLVEDIDFGDAETFEMKVKTVKESYFTTEATAASDESSDLVGTDSESQASISEAMARYTQAVSQSREQ